MNFPFQFVLFHPMITFVVCFCSLFLAYTLAILFSPAAIDPGIVGIVLQFVFLCVFCHVR